MKRLAMAAVGLALVVGALGACTRTVERLVVATATPQWNLSQEEAIALVKQRVTEMGWLDQLMNQPVIERTWDNRAALQCTFEWGGLDYMIGLWQRASQGARATPEHWSEPIPDPVWEAALERPERWRVQVSCPPFRFSAAWTVNDQTQQIIPVAGVAD